MYAIKDLKYVGKTKKIFVCEKNYFVVEKKPCRRTIKTIDNDGKETYYNLPFPYLYFLIQIVSSNESVTSYSLYLFFSNHQIESVKEVVNVHPFPNGSVGGYVCLDVPIVHDIVEMANDVMSLFWNTSFDADMGQADYFQSKKLITNYAQWEQLSNQEMLEISFVNTLLHNRLLINCMDDHEILVNRLGKNHV